MSVEQPCAQPPLDLQPDPEWRLLHATPSSTPDSIGTGRQRNVRFLAIPVRLPSSPRPLLRRALVSDFPRIPPLPASGTALVCISRLSSRDRRSSPLLCLKGPGGWRRTADDWKAAWSHTGADNRKVRTPRARHHEGIRRSYRRQHRQRSGCCIALHCGALSFYRVTYGNVAPATHWRSARACQLSASWTGTAIMRGRRATPISRRTRSAKPQKGSPAAFRRIFFSCCSNRNVDP